VGMIELDEGIILLSETEFLGEHLLGEPVVAIDVDLDGKGEKRLQANVHEAKSGIEEVVVEDALWATGVVETRTILALTQLDRAAGFFETQDGNQALLDGTFEEHCPDEVFFAAVALEILVRDTSRRGRRLGVIHQGLRKLLNH